MDLNLRLQHDLVAIQQDTDLHVLVELAAPAAPVDDTRQPLRVALVIDRSGSMADGKLDAARRSARYLVEQLHGDDQLALVTYDDTVELAAALAPVDAGRLTAAIETIRPGGATNLSGGWLKGVEELKRTNDGIRRVVLLTDGLANHGITDPTQLQTMAATIAADGVSTSTIGFGDGFDEHLLAAMADAGRGSSHFAETPDDAPGIFAAEFDDLVSLVAQNLSVEIRPSEHVTVVGVLNDFPTVAVPGGVQVQVGDAFAGQTLRVVARLQVPALAQLGLATVGEVTVRWVSVGDQIAEHAVTQPLVVNAVSADDAATVVDDPGVVEEVTVLLAGRATAEAGQLADRGEFDQARERVDQAIADLQQVAPNHPATRTLQDTIDQLGRTVGSLDADGYTPAEAKRLYYESRKLTHRRRSE